MDAPMSSPYEQQKQQLIDALRRSRGEASLVALGKIADLAQRHQDTQTVIAALAKSIRAASRLDKFGATLAALERLTTLYRTDTAYAEARSPVLWYHKWIAEQLVEYTDVSRDVIEGMFQNMERLFVAEKVGRRPIYMKRCHAAWMMGRKEEARNYFELWQAEDSGKSDDCPACEASEAVEYHLAFDAVEPAMEAAAPILGGKLFCAEVPAITFSRLLGLALTRNKLKLAEAMHRNTRRVVRTNPKLLACLGRHIIYLALTGRPAAARRLAAVAFSRAPEASDYNRFGAYVAGMFWFSMLARDQIANIRLPRNLELSQGNENVSTPEGAAWCLTRASDLAKRFDARNGNSRYVQRLDESEKMIREICKVQSSARQ
jgi:hypothetical protein